MVSTMFSLTASLSNVILFIWLNVGLFLLFRIPVGAMMQYRSPRSVNQDSLAKKREQLNKKKLTRWQKHQIEVTNVLAQSNIRMGWNVYIRTMLGFSLMGVTVGLLIGNPMLSVTMGMCMGIVPFQYFKLKRNAYTKALNEQVKDVLGPLTYAYIQSGDITDAINRIRYDGLLKEPLLEIFRKYTVMVGMIKPDVVGALVQLRNQVDNPYFQQWISIVIQCQNEPDKKLLLPGVLDRMASAKMRQNELDTEMMSIWRDYITVAFLTIANIPMMKVLDADWYRYLMHTNYGKAVVAVTFLAVFLCSLYVAKVNNPVSSEGV